MCLYCNVNMCVKKGSSKLNLHEDVTVGEVLSDE